jgi:hypothetical protein
VPPRDKFRGWSSKFRALGLAAVKVPLLAPAGILTVDGTRGNRCITARQGQHRAAGWCGAIERDSSGGWRAYRHCTGIHRETCQSSDSQRKGRTSRRTIARRNRN